MANKIALIIVGAVAILSALLFAFRSAPQESQEYAPNISPADFSASITNQYFTLTPGKKMIYEARTDEGVERIEIVITGETKIVMGVEALVYWDRVWVNDVLVEDTRDYLAQDRDGNVWYFGEDVDNYKSGTLVDHAGSWLAGENGAQPGIWIKAVHTIGDSYRQEYYKGEAEDMRDVVAVNETVTVPYGTFTGCVKMYDWTPLDSGSKEHKYYCPDAGAMMREEHLVTGEKTELIRIERPD